VVGQRLDRPTLVPPVVQRVWVSRLRRYGWLWCRHRLRGRPGRRRLLAGYSLSCALLVVRGPTVWPAQDRPCVVYRLHPLTIATKVRMPMTSQSAERRVDRVAIGARRDVEIGIEVAHGFDRTVRRFARWRESLDGPVVAWDGRTRPARARRGWSGYVGAWLGLRRRDPGFSQGQSIASSNRSQMAFPSA
jgi:hypothetical protein